MRKVVERTETRVVTLGTTETVTCDRCGREAPHYDNGEDKQARPEGWLVMAWWGRPVSAAKQESALHFCPDCGPTALAEARNPRL